MQLGFAEKIIALFFNCLFCLCIDLNAWVFTPKRPILLEQPFLLLNHPPAPLNGGQCYLQYSQRWQVVLSPLRGIKGVRRFEVARSSFIMGFHNHDIAFP